MFKIRRSGINQLQDQLSDGLEAVADRLLIEAQNRAPVLTGDVKGSLRTNKEHSREWPKPAVFVATSSGDGFFIHEGTSDTPAQPFLSMALDAMQRQIPSIIRSKTKGKEYGIHR